MIPAAELDFDTHFRRARLNFGALVDREDYFLRQALSQHLLCVHDALRDAPFVVHEIQQHLRSDEASRFLLSGAMRRLLMMFGAYRNLLAIIPVERTQSLSSDESAEVDRDLNFVYANIGGVADNLAWVLYSEARAREHNLPSVRDRDRGLFLKDFKVFLAFWGIERQVWKHDTWFKDYLKRRNPAVHRTPFYVPPQFIFGPDDEKRYRTTLASWHAAIGALKFEEADCFQRDLSRIGRFHPVFRNDETDVLYDLFPQFPQDVGQTVALCGLICAAVKAATAGEASP